MTSGTPAADIAQLLGGAVLLLSFVMLRARRIGVVINAYALQGIALALAAAWQGHVQSAPGLYATALIAFAAKAIAIPFTLRRHVGAHRAVEPSPGISGSPAAAIGLVALSALVVLPVTAGGATPLARVELTIALSVVLLGLLAAVARRNAVGQVVGLLSLENGLMLAAIGIAGMPLVWALSLALLVLVAAIVAGVVALDTSAPARPRSGT